MAQRPRYKSEDAFSAERADRNTVDFPVVGVYIFAWFCSDAVYALRAYFHCKSPQICTYSDGTKAGSG